MTTIRVALEGARSYLSQHPEEVRYRDGAAVATLLDGLTVGVEDASGRSVTTDMPTGVGGRDSAPSPGWLLRAAIASCVATLIKLTAAERGVDLDRVTVTVDSESDDRGILGMDEATPAGPLSVRCAVQIGWGAGGEAVDRGALEELVRYAVDHCPVTDSIRREIPLEVTTSYS
jgi:uncharacterized OsmC-like protein